MSKFPSPSEIDKFIENIIAEDLTDHDITSESVIDQNIECNAVIEAKTKGILCGIGLVGKIFLQIDPTIVVTKIIEDGTAISPGDTLLKLNGKARAILAGERTALNLLQHLSGISTLTGQFVEQVRKSKAVITDTRKTLPGLRGLQKYAVSKGGGHNHRMNLADGILIKDNHIKFNEINGLSISDVVKKSRANSDVSMKIEVEVDHIDQIESALGAGADVIMLDNMDPPTMARAVQLISGRAVVEASGSITLSTVAAVAESGVDVISVGWITHSAPCLDLGLDFQD